MDTSKNVWEPDQFNSISCFQSVYGKLIVMEKFNRNSTEENH